MLTTKKMYDNLLPEWTSELIQSKGYGISRKALILLVDHIGNDLNRINNEINKILVNLGTSKNITEDDIEKYVGVSKEYNPFELQDAIAKKDISKTIRIIQYFEANPKAGSIHLILPTLYNLFSKTFMMFGQSGDDEKSIASILGVYPSFVKTYVATKKNYAYDGVENALLLLHSYNMKSLGVNDTGTSDASLMKELVIKLMTETTSNGR